MIPRSTSHIERLKLSLIKEFHQSETLLLLITCTNTATKLMVMQIRTYSAKMSGLHMSNVVLQEVADIQDRIISVSVLLTTIP